MTRTLVTFTVLVLGIVVACSSEHASSHSASPETACSRDTRKDTFLPGLEKKSASLSVTLLESKPGPPVKGSNEMVFLVADGAGNPIDGAIVTVVPWMPDHAHGSATKPVVSASGGGIYRAASVNLTMAGLWQIKVGVQRSANGPTDEAMFQFCLDG